MQQGLSAYRALGTELWRTRFLALLAEAHWKAGQAEAGLQVVTEALAVADRTHERLYVAELYRLKGELTLQQSCADGAGAGAGWDEAEACFRQAIAIARRQGAQSLELRAVIALSRLWRQQGKGADAREMLAERYGRFTEGFDTADL